MRVNNEDLLNGSPLSLATSQNLKPIWLGHIANYAIQLKFTGSPVGNFTLQASNDDVDSRLPTADLEAKIVNWTTIADSAQAISAAGDHVWTVENAGYMWVRVVWTQTGGTGTLVSARSYCKGF
jgi:hypothetical protein